MHPIARSARPPFLVLTPICVLLGFSLAHYHGADTSPGLFVVILVGALCAHLSVNLLNEYQDFTSGLDAQTVRTPFSGGSGALPTHPEHAPHVLLASLVSLTITAGIGVWLATTQPQILWFGLIGVLLIVTYTRWINRHAWLCLIAPGLGFGFLMTQGTHLMFNAPLPPASWWIAGLPFLLTNNLLLLNQYPDVAADRAVGRRHFVIRFGVMRSNWVLLASVALTFGMLLILIAFGALPGIAVAAIAPAPLAALAVQGAFKHGERIGEHPAFMACNVAATCLTPLLLALALLWAAP